MEQQSHLCYTLREDRLPIDRYKRGKNQGEYRVKPGERVYLCFSSDFLLEDADPWRAECWRIIKERRDLHFLFLTKRIERFMTCIPEDWGEGSVHQGTMQKT